MGLQTCMLRNGHLPAKFNSKEFEYGNFKSSMLPAITLGAYLGVTFNAKIHKHTNRTSLNIKSILVFVVCLIFICLWWFLFFFFKDNFNTYILFELGFAPPLVLLIFVLFSEFEKYFVMKYIEKGDLESVQIIVHSEGQGFLAVE